KAARVLTVYSSSSASSGSITAHAVAPAPVRRVGVPTVRLLFPRLGKRADGAKSRFKSGAHVIGRAGIINGARRECCDVILTVCGGKTGKRLARILKNSFREIGFPPTEQAFQESQHDFTERESASDPKAAWRATTHTPQSLLHPLKRGDHKMVPFLGTERV